MKERIIATIAAIAALGMLLGGCALGDFLFPDPDKAEPTANPTPTCAAADDMVSFRFSIGGFGQYNDYEINADDMILTITLGETTGETLTYQWDEDQWHAFAEDVFACGVAQWDESYNNTQIMDGTQWVLEIRCDSGKIDSKGSNMYPDQWRRFLDVLSAHFGMTVR